MSVVCIISDMKNSVELAKRSSSFLVFASVRVARCFQVSKCCPEDGNFIFSRIAMRITDPLYPVKDSNVLPLQFFDHVDFKEHGSALWQK